MSMRRMQKNKGKFKANEADSLFKWFYLRTMMRNKNAIIGVVGSTGSGKSYQCLRIMEKMAEATGNDISDRKICFSIDELIELINSQRLKRGDVIILEEAGVNASSREWQTLVNKTFNYLLQTFRTLNLILLINLPDLKLLDINSRRILHGVMEMKGIDFFKNNSKSSFKVKQHNYHSGKDYWKFLRIKNNGKMVKVKYFTMKKPNKKLCDIYEAKRNNFTKQLNEKIEKDIETYRIKKHGQKSKNPLTKKQADIYTLDQQGVKPTQIASKLDISLYAVYYHLKAIRKKGYITSLDEKLVQKPH